MVSPDCEWVVACEQRRAAAARVAHGFAAFGVRLRVSP